MGYLAAAESCSTIVCWLYIWFALTVTTQTARLSLLTKLHEGACSIFWTTGSQLNEAINA